LDAAFALFPILGKGVRMSFTGELQDILNKQEPLTTYDVSPINRRIHGGIEFDFNDVFFIRAGYNQGYWTAGMEIDVGNTQLQMASYGEEIGDLPLKGTGTAYKTLEDRRYVAKFAYRF
jgi:hypothetical protein